jgi:hypothetical protein
MLFQVVQVAVSLAAILLVAWLVAWLGLGADVRLEGEEQAHELARASLCGFEPAAVALDRAGIAALLRGTDGRVMLLRRHGAQFAARILDSHAFARLDRNFLTIGTGEPTFGKVTLDLGDQAQVWAASLRRVKG